MLIKFSCQRAGNLHCWMLPWCSAACEIFIMSLKWILKDFLWFGCHKTKFWRITQLSLKFVIFHFLKSLSAGQWKVLFTMDYFCTTFLTQLFHFIFFFFMLHCERLFSQKLREVGVFSFSCPKQHVSRCVIKFHYQSFKCPYVLRGLLTGKENIARCPQGFHKNISLFHHWIFSIQVSKWAQKSSPAHP